jgi:hypothetical protein
VVTVGVPIIVTVDGVTTDEIRQLRSWLLAEEEMRGRIELLERPPDSGRLGPVLEALRVIAEPGSAVLATVLVAWLKQRRSSMKTTVTAPDGKKVSIEADRIRLMDADALSCLASKIVRLTSTDQPVPPSGRTLG